MPASSALYAGMMGDPTRSRNRGVIVFAASIAALLGARAMPDASVGHGWHLALMLAGMICAPISGVWVLICWIDAKKYRRLKAGVGVVARWTVDTARWEWFRGKSREWDKLKDVRPNGLNLDQTPGPSGLEIVLTREAILVGDHFISFEPHVVLYARAGYVDIHFTIVKPKGPPVHIAVRAPLAPSPGSDAQGAQIAEAFRVARATEDTKGVTKGQFMLIFFVGFPAVVGIVMALAFLLKRGP